MPATIRGSTSRYGTSVQAPTLDVAGSLPQPVGANNHTTPYIAEKSLFTVVQPPMTFLAGVKDLFYGRVAAASIFSDFSKKDLQPAL